LAVKYMYVLGGIASCFLILPIATHFSVAWSVCLSSVCLSFHICVPCLSCSTDIDVIWQQVHWFGLLTHCSRLGFMTPP